MKDYKRYIDMGKEGDYLICKPCHRNSIFNFTPICSTMLDDLQALLNEAEPNTLSILNFKVRLIEIQNYASEVKPVYNLLTEYHENESFHYTSCRKKHVIGFEHDSKKVLILRSLLYYRHESGSIIDMEDNETELWVGYKHIIKGRHSQITHAGYKMTDGIQTTFSPAITAVSHHGCGTFDPRLERSEELVRGWEVLIIGGALSTVSMHLSRLLVMGRHKVSLFMVDPDENGGPFSRPLLNESQQDFDNFKKKISFYSDGDCEKFLAKKLKFHVIYDLDGLEIDKMKRVLDTYDDLEHYIFCSSSEVYVESHLQPIHEDDSIKLDQNNRKVAKEAWLASQDVFWTILRPDCLYGSFNCKDVDGWFFQRLNEPGRVIPLPKSNQLMRICHVKNLARALYNVIRTGEAIKRIINISGIGSMYNIDGLGMFKKYLSLAGLAHLCSVTGRLPDPKILYYNPKKFSLGRKFAFPFCDRMNRDKANILTSLKRFRHLLSGAGSTIGGLEESFEEFSRRSTTAAEFPVDDFILGYEKAYGEEEMDFELGDILEADVRRQLADLVLLDPKRPTRSNRNTDLNQLIKKASLRQKIVSLAYAVQTGQVELAHFEIDQTKFKSLLAFLEDWVGAKSPVEYQMMQHLKKIK